MGTELGLVTFDGCEDISLKLGSAFLLESGRNRRSLQRLIECTTQSFTQPCRKVQSGRTLGRIPPRKNRKVSIALHCQFHINISTTTQSTSWPHT